MSPKIQLIRVDNRLVHGQTGVTWSNSLAIDTIVVIDDETVGNIFSQKLMTSIAKAGNVNIAFYSIEEFITVYNKANSDNKLFLLVKSIQVVRILFERGIRFPKINIGNIHYERGRYSLTKKIYLTKQDVEDLNFLNENDNYIFYQDVPGTMIEKINLLDFDKLRSR